ncbi:hypothetical protein KKG90_05560 [Candidatus Bipolaricaulota bacterium]|nr:hypothetical protein [Candidatus Bipolaricaulota bacterium]
MPESAFTVGAQWSYTRRMIADRSPKDPPIEYVVTPPARLVDTFGVWEAALRAARTRKQLCYTLCSVVLAIALTLLLYSTFVYLWKLMSAQPPSAAELAELRRFIFTRSMMIVGVSVLLFGTWGLIHVIWIRKHHIQVILDVRNEAEKEGWIDSLKACGGKFNERRAQLEWQTYQQNNRRFRIGYQVAMAVGFVLALAGAFMR